MCMPWNILISWSLRKKNTDSETPILQNILFPNNNRPSKRTTKRSPSITWEKSKISLQFKSQTSSVSISMLKSHLKLLIPTFSLSPLKPWNHLKPIKVKWHWKPRSRKSFDNCLNRWMSPLMKNKSMKKSNQKTKIHWKSSYFKKLADIINSWNLWRKILSIFRKVSMVLYWSVKTWKKSCSPFMKTKSLKNGNSHITLSSPYLCGWRTWTKELTS